ncbi:MULTISPECIES: amidohydrolase [unclassified Microbacterium]|uniref:amidohydrolase n=1 Tax=unclassified Microbacterium TaxID=2609290 RepID=UPI00097EAEF1|nr:amidohydrolase [Microbacterium sp. JB110]RCS57236.1 amidohydrolase [Microbacterium sp. JB110]SJM59124.1 Exoenzymes regulatory protein AepA precursor [Frigoribacterium sp. JB110]
MTTHMFTNAKVFTGDSETGFASAFRVVDGTIDWVGDAAEVVGEGSVDLGGRTVLPGLIDSHTHPALIAGTAAAVECFPPAVTSVDALVETLRAHAASTSGEEWILGRGFDETRFPERRMPTIADLDQVSADRPVLVWRCDAHSAVCNSEALRLAGIDADTPDPEGSRFERDDAGRPNGVLTEIAAVSAVTSVIPPPTREEQIATILTFGEDLASRGIVAVCDLLSTRIDDPLGVFREAASRGLRTRVALYPGWDPEHPLADLAPGDTAGRIRVAGVKVVLDGAYSNRTAWVHEPYPESCDHGLRLVADDDVLAAADWARRNGVQLAVHAMGDRALDRVIELFADREPWLDDVPSVRIEHATLVSDDRAERMRAARMSFGIATHTVFFFAEYDGYETALRAEQVPDAYPISRLFGTIEALALSSDRPATAWSGADDVMLSIEAAVRRMAHNGTEFGADAAVTVPQAVLLYTGRARLLSPLHGVGRLAPGFDASFAVLDRDVFTVPEDEIASVRVAETWIDGQRVK